MARRLRRVTGLRRRIAVVAVALAASTALDAAAAVRYHFADIVVAQGTEQPINVNFASDDFDDVVFQNFTFPEANYQGALVAFTPGKIAGFTAGLNYATSLAPGVMINAASVGPAFEAALAYGLDNASAQFTTAHDAYVGFSFPTTTASVNYAWVRVDVDNAAGTLLIKDWAYEDQPGVGILAGDVGTLPLPGDLDGNRRVDGADVLAWQRTSANHTPFDYLDLVDNFGAGLPSSAPTSLATPEPRTFALAAALAGAWGGRRRRPCPPSNRKG